MIASPGNLRSFAVLQGFGSTAKLATQSIETSLSTPYEYVRNLPSSIPYVPAVASMTTSLPVARAVPSMLPANSVTRTGDCSYPSLMRPPANALVIVAAILGLCLSVRTAHADAVPPAPKRCPKGKVGVTDHGGPRCVLEAPKNCAPGYRGALGGKCVLATCSSDDQCKDGRRCLLVETCQEYRELHWSGWGWQARRLVSRDNFFAEPPSPRPDGPAKKAWVNLNICGQDGPCKDPAECRPVSLCYPPSAVGKTKAKVVASGTPGTQPVPSGDAPPVATDTAESASGGQGTNDAANQGKSTDPVQDTPNGDSGGCRKGGSVTSTPSLVGWVTMPLLVCVGLLRRRRRAATR